MRKVHDIAVSDVSASMRGNAVSFCALTFSFSCDRVRKKSKRGDALMKKILKAFLIVIAVIAAAFVALVVKIAADAGKQAEEQKKMVKPDEELIGERFSMPRDGLEAVEMNLYLRPGAERLPLVINLHGGAFIAGHADTLDSQSDRISNAWNVHVATVNYKLLSKDYDIAYAVREVEDTVKYFIRNAEEYGADPDKIYVMGYSAGGYHAMASVLALRREGVPVAGQIVCYGFLRDVMDIYAETSAEMPPSLFVVAEGDPIGESSLTYAEALRERGVSVEIKTYSGAMHGFIEENNPEYEKLRSHASMSPEQEAIAREAENYIGNWIAAQSTRKALVGE